VSGVNKVIIVGNLGRDPEVRYSQGGMAIGKLSVAVTEKIKKGDEWEEHTEWFRVTVFGKTAENAAQYLAKGRQVYVEGRLKTEKYKDKEGVEKTSTEVVASTLQYLGGGGDRGAEKEQPRGREPDRQSSRLAGREEPPFGAPPRRQGPKGTPAPPASDGFTDDDLPFMRLEPLCW
jgi:single-strand DNA-binding protein